MGPTWNRRYREYMEKIKSGSVFEIAEVLRDLIVLKREKELSFGEKNLLVKAEHLLAEEISAAQQVDEDMAVQKLRSLFPFAGASVLMV